MKAYEWIIRLIDQASGPLGKVQGAAGASSTALDKTTNSAQGLFFKLSNLGLVVGTITQVATALSAAVEPGQRFEQTAAEVAAITGANAEQMALMERSAKALSAELGGGASGNLTTYKSILSELGPQIASQPAALASMGRAAAILSKSMGGDTVGAVSALTTGLQQFRVNLTNPTSAAQAMTFQMNVMAAAANAGAAEVPQIAAALKQAGVAASGARVSFVETNAAIQVLAAGGIKGAEAGTALRNVLAKLGEGRFMPKDVQLGLKAAGVDVQVLSDKSRPLADRLRELAKIQGDGALVSKMFGLENQNAANILLRGIPQMQGFEKAITGTNAAVDAANILLNTNASRLDRAKARLELAGIAAFDLVKAYLPAIQTTGMLAMSLGQLYPMLALVGNGLTGVLGRLRTLYPTLLTGAVAAGRFGASLLLTGVQGVGAFIIRIGQAILGLGTFAVQLRLQAALALGVLQARLAAFSVGGFLAGLWASSTAALRAGGAWLWAGVVGLPALVAGFVRATAAQWAMNIAMNANPIGVIVLGVLALGTAVYLIIRHWSVVKGFLVELAKMAMKFNPFYWLLEGAKALFPGFEAWLNKLWGQIRGFLSTMLVGIKSIWDKVAPYFGFGTLKMPDIAAGLLSGGDNNEGNGLGGTIDPSAGLTDAVKGGLTSISGGGAKQTTFNISLGKFQDKIEIHTTTLQEGANDAVRILDEALLRVLNGVQQLAPTN